RKAELTCYLLSAVCYLCPRGPPMTKYVYYFGDGHAEGNAKMKEILGGKGAGLAEMTNIGVPVPPGFTISTEVCTYFYDHGKSYPPELKSSVEENLARVEKSVGKKFG